jgi:outer membrane protein insertion porin family
MARAMKNFILCLGFFAAFALFSALPQTVNAQSRVDDIRIEGLERIEESTVISYMDIRPGDPMTRDIMDRAVKSLFRTGLFVDVSVQQSANTLIVRVVENPVVNEIAFEGNDDIKNDELRAEIQLRPRQVFTRTKVRSDMNRLYQIYRRNGRFSARIEPKIIRLEQNRINLVFEIEEGPVTKVESIRFIGNRRFDDDTLRSEISTRESRWYSFISSNDRYDPDRLAFDEELLKRFYLSQGYADFQVVSSVAELSQNREDFFVTFTVSEGGRYKMRNISINSEIRDLNPEALRDQVTLEEGDWYDADAVQVSVDNIINALGDMQYAFVNVRAALDRDRNAKALDLVFNIGEAPRIFVERIDIQGNARTMDKVIRREIELVEGDPFMRTKLLNSERNIRNLDYFETVEVRTKPGSAPDKSVIEVDVSEKSTGELSIGAGFSTTDGPLADLRIRERNLLGKGQDLLFSTTVAGERTEFDLSFTEPYFLNRDLAAGFDLFHVTRDLQDEASFDQERTGGALRIGYPLSEKWSQQLLYRLERNTIEDVQSTASRFIQEQSGTRRTSAISQRLVYDDRDSRIFPTDGMWAWVDTEVAGLGGDAQYISGKIGSSWYTPITEKVILNVLGEVAAIEGWGDEGVAINERFYLGGNTLRGFERAGIGPRDVATDDSLGGTLYYRGSVELSFPIGLAEELGVKGHAFTDFGSVWDADGASGFQVEDENSLRATGGLGLSWRSPLGPIRVDYAVPYVDEAFDKEENFRFSFGTRF